MRDGLLIPLAALTLLAGCESSAARTVPPSLARETSTASYTPDTVRAAQLAAFRRGLPMPISLSGGAGTREELVRSFVEALEARDTAALRGMILSRAEFAWLYYPTATQALPPYDLDPATFWMMTSQQSDRGLGKALGALGGKALPYAGHRCEGTTNLEGDNRLFGPCLVRLAQSPGDTVELRLFGLVMERAGRWKFVSYGNRID